MARNKRAFNFADFDFAESAFDLFQNSIRSGMDYDANISDQFQAKVLTRPTKLTGDPRNISFKATDGKTEIFAFMVRIQGKQSPHRFLPDPCRLEYTKTSEQRTRAFNSIQLHTKVLMSPDSESPLPSIDDIINITLERGEFGSFKTDLAKQYVSIVSEAKIPSGQIFGACQTLAQKFSESDISLVSVGSFSIPKQATYAPNNGASIPNVENGRLEESGIILSSPDPALYDSRAGTVKLIPEAIESFEQVMRDYITDHNGAKISISSHYRTYDTQVAMKAKKGKYAATPGKSNHGWAVAFDIDGTREIPGGGYLVSGAPDTNRRRFDSPIYKWLDNGGRGRHGWVNPPSLRRESGGVIEAWHWENLTIGKAHFVDTPSTPEYANTEIETEPESPT